MVRKMRQYVRSKNIVDLDSYRDVVLARAERTLLDNDLHNFEKLLDENDKVDIDYKNVLLCILTKKENVEPHKKRKKINDEVIQQDGNSDVEEENDPQYECFLKSLKEHGKSYILEYEKDGSPAVVKYERDENKENELPHQISPDLDYVTFLQASTLVDGYFVYTHSGYKVVYEKNGDNDWEKEKQDDGLSSDVEILGSTSFYENEFRQQVTAVLRKPYDKEEYDKLWKDISVRKPKACHRELRHGRARDCTTEKDGKSYLDTHPDLEQNLKKYRYEKGKRLAILRGFFFWLKHVAHDGSFKPWTDEECLAVDSEAY